LVFHFFLFFQHLEESVRNGLIQRHENKGNVSYKDPDSLPRGKSKGLKLSPACDLTKVFVKAVRELGEIDGSTIRAIEKFVASSYEIEFEQVRIQAIILSVTLYKSVFSSFRNAN
jgi:histone acetyltransferase MYST4